MNEPKKATESLLSQIEQYWEGRVGGYSKVNQHELSTGQDRVWYNEIACHIPSDQTLNVLDVGTGPGFFAIMFTKMGHKVTAVDYTAPMLEEAKANADELANSITWMHMDAQNLAFDDNSFDLVISRNLTWVLEDPAKAYSEWIRVLKPGGTLLNFDANWYTHKFDAEKLAEYEQDRANVAALDMEDQNLAEDIDEDAMDDIVRKLDICRAQRPDWDLNVLAQLPCDASADIEVWSRVWDEEEKVNFASTPLFMVKARKH